MKKILLFLMAISFSSSIIAQEDEWSTKKSNNGLSERFANSVVKLTKKKEKKVKAEHTESLDKVLTDNYPPKNKLVGFRPYGNYGQLKGGSYRYVEVEKNEDDFVEAIWIGAHIDKKTKQLKKDVADKFKVKVNKNYIRNNWFFNNNYLISEYRSSDNYQLYISGKSIVKYRKANSDGEVEVKSVALVLGKKGSKIGKWKKKIEAYHREIESRVNKDISALRAAEQEFRAKHSLEHKTVKNIELVFDENSISETSRVIGFVVSFSDGTKDKTQNLGGNIYVEDLKAEYYGRREGIGEEYRTDDWGGHCHCTKAKLHFDKLKKDEEEKQLNMTISSKYQPDLKFDFTITIGKK